jgi:hypothetical protein
MPGHLDSFRRALRSSPGGLHGSMGPSTTTPRALDQRSGGTHHLARRWRSASSQVRVKSAGHRELPANAQRRTPSQGRSLALKRAYPQLRALHQRPCQGEGRGFESRRPLHEHAGQRPFGAAVPRSGPSCGAASPRKVRGRDSGAPCGGSLRSRTGAWSLASRGCPQRRNDRVDALS